MSTVNDDAITLEMAVRELVQQYFQMVEVNHHSGFLHVELIRRVERELFEQVLKYTDANQSQAARILGVSRTTLRKKLAEYDLLD